MKAVGQRGGAYGMQKYEVMERPVLKIDSPGALNSCWGTTIN